VSVLVLFALEQILQPLMHTLTLALQSQKLCLADLPCRVSLLSLLILVFLTVSLTVSLPVPVYYARQHICYSAYMPRQFRPSVRLSVTRVYCVKTSERIIEILSPSDRPNILVFRHQRSLRKSDGFAPNGGAKYKGRNKK